MRSSMFETKSLDRSRNSHVDHSILIRASIKPGTFRNMPEHEKIKVIFMKKKIIKKNDNNNIVFAEITK